MDDLVSVPVLDPHALLTMKQETSLTQDVNLDKAEDWVAHGTQKVRQPFGEVGPTDVSPTQNRIKTIKSLETVPQVIPKRRPVVTPPAKKKAKNALGTPLSAPSEFERPRSVVKKKGKQVARQVVQKWLDF